MCGSDTAMARRFAETPKGGRTANQAAEELTSPDQLQVAELARARSAAARHPKTMQGWRPGTIDLDTGAHDFALGEVAHPSWRKVYELENAHQQARRRQFLQKWFSGKIVALAEPHTGADWFLVEERHLQGWSIEYVTSGLWRNSRLKLPKRSGPECYLVFYERDDFERITSTAAQPLLGRPKKSNWKTEAQSALKVLAASDEFDLQQALQGDGYQAQVVSKIHRQLVEHAGERGETPPGESTVKTYVTGTQWRAAIETARVKLRR